MDVQKLIGTCHTDNLIGIRKILECKNQKLYFERNASVPSDELHRIGIAMLFVALERNSDLAFGALRHLNVMHKMLPTVRFRYDRELTAGMRFDSVADTFMNDFLMTIYTCAQLPFNGARPEALLFFAYWIRDPVIADEVFARILTTWPWTNRNKYYFLEIIFSCHGFVEMLRRNELMLTVDVPQFFKGVALSLEYRNLISPGQTLVITLTRQDVPEAYGMIADVLKRGTEFTMLNCVNHWMRCIDNPRKLFEMLELGDVQLTTDPKFEYLKRDGFLRLVVFRSCFKAAFNASANAQSVDEMIAARSRQHDRKEHKVAILDVIISKTIDNPLALNDNLDDLEGCLKANMYEECTSLRQDTLKVLPNLLYMLAPMLKNNSNTHPERLRKFIRFLRDDIFITGMRSDAYQPLIFAIRTYEMIVKTLYGTRSDRLIKRFNDDVNNRLKAFLRTDDLWPLFSSSTYRKFLRVLQCEYDDVRNISCELLIRFFPQHDIKQVCSEAVRDPDIHRCSYAHYLSRVAIHFDVDDGSRFYEEMHEQLRANLSDYRDPLAKIRLPGGHLYGALNSLTEFYTRAGLKYIEKDDCDRADDVLRPENIANDIRMATEVVDMLLRFLHFGGDDHGQELVGSPSFTTMDHSLLRLVSHSAYRKGDKETNKLSLLVSLWTSIKACCDLASGIGIFLLDRPKLHDHNLNASIEQCYRVSATVLLQCRHKGAIEAAGLSLGRLVRCITDRFAADSTMFGILQSSVAEIFRCVERTDTTRRGAGFSILVQHLVRNDRHKERPILKHVMQTLLSMGADMSKKTANAGNSSHYDNLLASVLHFICVLVKDGDLRVPLTDYMVRIFDITLATIRSREWVVRNASLQLFGAFVPKIVGQTQFYVNNLVWEPVFMIYPEVRITMHSMDHLLQQTLDKSDKRETVLVVAALQFLSRVELLDDHAPGDDRFKERFYRLLGCRAANIRVLAALCLTRFHKFYEIPNFVRRVIPVLCQVPDPNMRHGLLLAVKTMLEKYLSDCRSMPLAEHHHLFADVRRLFGEHWQGVGAMVAADFYLRAYLFDVLKLCGGDEFEQTVLKLMFDQKARSTRGWRSALTEMRVVEAQHFGYSVWLQKMFDEFVVRDEGVLPPAQPLVQPL